MKRNIGQILSRLLSPFFLIRWSFLGVVQTTTWVVYDIYVIFLFKRLGVMIDNGNYANIQSLLIEFAIVSVVYFFLKFVERDWFWPDTSAKLQRHLRKKHLMTYARFDNTAVEKLGTGRLINIVKEGVNQWVATLEQLQIKVPDILLKFLIAIYFVAELGWIYGIAFIGILIAMRTVIIYINRFAIAKRNERKKVQIIRSRFFVRFLSAKFEIFQSNKVDHELQYSDELLVETLSIDKKLNFYIRALFNIPLSVIQLFTLLIVYYARSHGIDGTFSFGIFNGLIVTIGYLSQLVVNSTQTFKDLTNQFTHIEKFRELIDSTAKIEQFSGGKEFSFQKGSIELHNISFTYDGGKNIFQRFDLTIEPGQKTALVGASGSGKSTLVKLIAGYLRPESGYITVDGQILPTDDEEYRSSAVSLSSYYKHIGYLTQEPSVFDGSIRENLLYSVDGDITQEKIEEAIKMAECRFVFDFPDGLDTEIGERGIRLSGGQRQRLAIAKIFLKNPAIVFLDEPTSALDSFSEEAVTIAMNNLFEGRTVIIIAHRLQTTMNADDIIVMEEGGIIERGTHQELIDMDGNYAKMLRLQAGF